MPTLPCPMCHQPTPRGLDEVNQTALVNYYRCDVCGTVWHVPKLDPLGPIQIVATGTPPSIREPNRR